MTKHIILIGFKHTGKSAVGKVLAKKLDRDFVDLDEGIVKLHTGNTGEKSNFRAIFKKHGEDYFRKLENEALEKILSGKDPVILALGGSTPLFEDNQKLLRGHKVVHIKAPKSVVFERIMIGGKPAFFPEGGDAFDSFQKFWAERIPVFDSLAQINIQNNGTIDELLDEILKNIEHE